MGEAVAACDALLEKMPQPRVSTAEALRDLTDEQRAVLLASRDETLATVRMETAQMQERLDSLTMQAHALGAEFKGMLREPDRVQPREYRLREIADWFTAHDDEVGVLKVAIAELSDFADQLEAL